MRGTLALCCLSGPKRVTEVALAFMPPGWCQKKTTVRYVCKRLVYIRWTAVRNSRAWLQSFLFPLPHCHSLQHHPCRMARATRIVQLAVPEAIEVPVPLQLLWAVVLLPAHDVSGVGLASAIVPMVCSWLPNDWRWPPRAAAGTTSPPCRHVSQIATIRNVRKTQNATTLAKTPPQAMLTTRFQRKHVQRVQEKTIWAAQGATDDTDTAPLQGGYSRHNGARRDPANDPANGQPCTVPCRLIVHSGTGPCGLKGHCGTLPGCSQPLCCTLQGRKTLLNGRQPLQCCRLEP